MPVGRRIVLGVTGGIAAYKSVYLARRLVESGNEVRVAMTSSAGDFVGAQTFAALTGSPVVNRLVSDPSSVSPHTELGRWAEAVVVAPATAATIARLANGLSEDPVSAIVLATRAPVLVAPAMHTEMWEHPATRRNVGVLIEDGVGIVGPASGALAGGDEGPGRMAEPDEIVAALDALLGEALRGVRVLVTAGGTREAIDPVRYIGNRSSGKMGHAVAEEAARRGATVTLVTTSHLATPPAVERVVVESAAEMDAAVRGLETDLAVLAAAVADFRPADVSASKLSRSDGPPAIPLEPTPDILAGVAGRSPRPLLVGFAAETAGVERAVAKAKAKEVDLLVYNDVTEEGSGFGADTNRVTLVWRDGRTEPWPMLSKREVAGRLLDLLAEMLGNRAAAGEYPEGSRPVGGSR